MARSVRLDSAPSAAGPFGDLKPPCFTANQKGGNGGNALTLFCAK